MPAEYGGAPLLGLKGLVVKTHGSSKAMEVKQFHSSVCNISQEAARSNEKIKRRSIRIRLRNER